MECYKCGSEEHNARDCDVTWRAAVPSARARTFGEHMQRIDGYVAAWFRGEIGMQAKREAIAAENYQWYGGHMTRNGIRLTRA